MEREVRYCTSEDGVRLAYCVQGGGPVLVVCPLFIEAFSLDELFSEVADFVAALGEGRRLVRYDKRGTGLSQRDVPDLSQMAQVRDLEAVVNAVGEARLALWAPSLSGTAALEYAARNPDRVARLVLWSAFARGREVMTRQAVDGIAQLCRSNWLLGSQLTADLSGRNEFPGLTSKMAATYRDSVTGDIAAETITQAWETYDASDFLSAIKCPTLIMNRRGDPTFPFALGQQLAEQVPNARMVPFEGTASHPVLGDWTTVARVSNAFLNEDAETRARQAGVDARETQGSFRTVLFTDLVGHTEMMSRLGDERGRDVLREHERITREVLKAHGGTEVKTMGDGFMASFGSVTKAVECAIALQRAFAGREGEPLSVRVGLNAGEPIEEDGDLFGATVILASRIAAKADGGEILVADTVRGLCSGKGFLFADRGEFVAKGFEDPVRVYEVSWRN